LNHKVIRIVVALVIGSAIALYSYGRITDPLPRQQRVQEEAVVTAARDLLRNIVAPDSELQIVDPLQPDRKIGKVYVYPTDDGWDVSGHYRRSEQDPWHPWLMSVDASMQLQKLLVRDSDPEFAVQAAKDPRIEIAH
jgi:Ni,Fe-hydrogenase maturation factor